LLEKLRDVTALFYELELRASDFGASSSNDQLFERINDLVSKYAELDDLQKAVDIDIPQDVLEYIEAGRNPTVYTRQFSEAVVRDNQYLNGKLQGYEDFASCLLDELQRQFPETKT
ncbi:mediator of RNA polymerase II transcription subunit 10, partial [Protomyces lactucae-debilis]